MQLLISIVPYWRGRDKQVVPLILYTCILEVPSLNLDHGAV